MMLVALLHFIFDYEHFVVRDDRVLSKDIHDLIMPTVVDALQLEYRGLVVVASE